MSKPKQKTNSDTEVSEWVKTYGDRLYHIALLRVRNAAIAEDIVQETFLSAHKAFDTFEDKASPFTWLATILKNKVIDHFRKNNKAISVSYDEQPTAEEKELINKNGLWKVSLDKWDGGAEDLLERQGFRKQLHDCLNEMPDNLRQAFVLKVLDDISTEEVCETLNLTPNNLWVILYRARMRLRRCLDRSWFRMKRRS